MARCRPDLHHNRRKCEKRWSLFVGVLVFVGLPGPADLCHLCCHASLELFGPPAIRPRLLDLHGQIKGKHIKARQRIDTCRELRGNHTHTQKIRRVESRGTAGKRLFRKPRRVGPRGTAGDRFSIRRVEISARILFSRNSFFQNPLGWRLRGTGGKL